MIFYRATFVAIAALLFASLLPAQARSQARVVEIPALEIDDVTIKDLPSGMIRLSWTTKEPSCDYSISYSVYRDTKEDFVPSKGNQIASGITSAHFDTRDISGIDNVYRVEAVKGPAPKAPVAGKPIGQPGSVHGRVFAITKGGDIKPARLATVHLVFEARAIGHRLDQKFECEETAYPVFLERRLKAMEQNGSDSCKRQLMDDRNGVIGLLKWVQQGSHEWQDLIADADEEGNFTFPKVPPGKYDILVQNQAGINEAFWNQEVWVQPGQLLNVKVANVEHSCSDLE
jgi:hypothetical protein